MTFLIFGDGPEELAWAQVLAAHHEHRLGAAFPGFKMMPDLPGSLDMDDAWHPQTLLAYAMNGDTLPTGHGAPLRLRVPRQLGYKSVKYLSRITVVDSLARVRDGLGSVQPEYGYSWYAGI